MGRTGDPQGGLGRVGGPSVWSRTGQRTLGEVQVRSGDPRRGPGRVERPSRRFGTGLGTPEDFWTGRGTLPEVREGSGDSRGNRFEVLNDSEDPRAVQAGSMDPLGGLGRVGRPSGKFRTGRGTLGDVRNVSGDSRGFLEWLGDSRGGPRRVGGLLVKSIRGSGDPRIGPERLGG